MTLIDPVALLGAIYATVKDVPGGAPLGPMYAALMASGITYEQFDAIVETLIHMKLVRKENNCLYVE